MKYKMLVHQIRELENDIVTLEENETPLNIMTHTNPFGVVIELFTLKKIKEE